MENSPLSGIISKTRVGIFSLVILLAGCVEEPKRMVLPVDLRFARVFYAGYQDKTKLTDAPDWPADSVKTGVLLQSLNTISVSLENEIKKFSKKGRYTIVTNSPEAQILLFLHFLPYQLSGDTLILPVEVHVQDRRSGKTIRRNFKGRGVFQAAGQPSRSENPYHYYGGLLMDLRRNFPKWDIARLFYSRELPANEM